MYVTFNLNFQFIIAKLKKIVKFICKKLEELSFTMNLSN